MAWVLHSYYCMDKALTVEAVRTKYHQLHPLMTSDCAVNGPPVRLNPWDAAARASSPKLPACPGPQSGPVGELKRRANQPRDDLAAQRVRAPGGGRHLVEQKDSAILTDLQVLVDSSTRGDPQSPLCWTSKSVRRVAEELSERGHAVSHQTVAALLDDLGYSLQANRKTKEGQGHADRDAQFEYISRQVRAFQEDDQPAISVDAKKKENIGDFRNPGREWHRRRRPEEVRAKDFPDKRLGKAIPEGVYDLSRNEGWVSVGVDHDTAEFAGVSIRRWWEEMGSLVYPGARRLLITADAGGSNGYRPRLWKVVLQGLANDLGLRISVCHFPPGTSKWNKIEHRMFCYITKNWRGKPLRSRAVIVNLIGGTTTKEGLRIQAELDTDLYRTGIRISDEQLAEVQLQRATFHGEWNYTIAPQN